MEEELIYRQTVLVKEYRRISKHLDSREKDSVFSELVGIQIQILKELNFIDNLLNKLENEDI